MGAMTEEGVSYDRNPGVSSGTETELSRTLRTDSRLAASVPNGLAGG
jgi:hypothetical protein